MTVTHEGVNRVAVAELVDILGPERVVVSPQGRLVRVHSFPTRRSSDLRKSVV